ncbi:MAG TPA: UDP-3-O-(3-hydroxymyristoyl)glucosamine N-acyltransferase [Atribacteraceae bacterium]|nr:UDP-3-O-(3-hydroxymyristoyl)glucosamine N-acyltransferase [Atribacteraceae bacterium]
MQLREIVNITGGRLAGDPAFHVYRLSVPENAGSHDLVFVFDTKALADISRSRALAVVSRADHRISGKYMLFVDNPRRAFIQLAPFFTKTTRPAPGIDPLAYIHPTANIAAGVHVGAFVYVGAGTFIGRDTCLFPQIYIGENVTIGSDCILYPHVVIREGCRLGDRVVLHPGVIIGGDGFGYEAEEGGMVKIPHLGTVEIGNDVEIGANATVDRGTIGSTRIDTGTKLDNLVMVAHNVNIGKHVVIAAQSGLAGSARVGDHTLLGGQSGVVDHINVGRSVKIAGRAVVTSDIPDHSFISGFPAQDHRLELRERAQARRLPTLWTRIKELEKAVFGKEKPGRRNGHSNVP